MGDVTRLDDLLLIPTSLLVAKPVGTIVQNSVDGLYYVSLDSVTPSYDPFGSGAGLEAGVIQQGIDLDTGSAGSGAIMGTINNVPCLSFPLGADAYWRSNMPAKIPTYTGGDLTINLLWGGTTSGGVGETISLQLDMGFGKIGETIEFTATQQLPVIDTEAVLFNTYYNYAWVIPEAEVVANPDAMFFRIVRLNSDATFASNFRIIDLSYAYAGLGA